MGMIGNSLAQGLISGANIQDGTVDTPDIKDSAVTAAKIASAVVTPAKMDFSAGTANGVLYLNGSKVASSGSALVFDGTNFGVGVTPATPLHVYKTSGTSSIRIASGSGTGEVASVQFYGTDGGSAAQIYSQIVTGVTTNTAGSEAGYIGFETTSAGSTTEKMRVLSGGDVCINTTTSAGYWTKTLAINGSSGSTSDAGIDFIGYRTGNGDVGGISFMNAASSNARLATIFGEREGANNSGALTFLTMAAGTSYERVRITSGGNVGIGLTNPSAPLTIASAGTAAAIHIRGRSDGYGDVIFFDSTGSTQYGFVEGGTTGLSLSGVGATSVIFGTNGVDRGRIASNGFTHFTSDGQYYNSLAAWHSMETNAQDNPCIFINRHASGPYGPFIYFTGASPNSTSRYFLAGNDATNDKFYIYSNGTFGSRTSTYGGISDIKVKQDIVDASSQWDDIKALRFRKYRFKDDPTGPLQLGLISQEAELVSPGLVFETPDTTMDEEGNRIETGEVTKSVKYSILYMKAVVALQEAMNRIEQLETRLAALEGA
jgi:hypothetical protein